MGDSLSWCCCDENYSEYIIWGDPGSIATIGVAGNPVKMWEHPKTYTFYASPDTELFISGPDIPYYEAPSLVRSDPFGGRHSEDFGATGLPPLHPEAVTKAPVTDVASCSFGNTSVGTTSEPSYSVTNERRWGVDSVLSAYTGGADTYVTCWGFTVDGESGLAPVQDNVVAVYSHTDNNFQEGTNLTLVQADIGSPNGIGNPTSQGPFILVTLDRDMLSTDGALLTRSTISPRLKYQYGYAVNESVLYGQSTEETRDLSATQDYTSLEDLFDLPDWYSYTAQNPNPPDPTNVVINSPGNASFDCEHRIDLTLDMQSFIDALDNATLVLRSNNDGKNFLGYSLLPTFSSVPSSGSAHWIYHSEAHPNSIACGLTPMTTEPWENSSTVTAISNLPEISITTTINPPVLQICELGVDGRPATRTVAGFDPFTEILSVSGYQNNVVGIGVSDTYVTYKVFDVESPISYCTSSSGNLCITGPVLMDLLAEQDFHDPIVPPLGQDYPFNPTSSVAHYEPAYYNSGEPDFSPRGIDGSDIVLPTVDHAKMGSLQLKVVDVTSNTVKESHDLYSDGWKPQDVYSIPNDTGFYLVDRYYKAMHVGPLKRFTSAAGSSGGSVGGWAEKSHYKILGETPVEVSTGYDLTGAGTPGGVRGRVGDLAFRAETSILITNKPTTIQYTGTSAPTQSSSYTNNGSSLHIMHRPALGAGGGFDGSAYDTDDWNLQLDHASNEDFYLIGVFPVHLGVTNTSFGGNSIIQRSSYTYGNSYDSIATGEGIYNKVSVYKTSDTSDTPPIFYEDPKMVLVDGFELVLGDEKYHVNITAGWESYNSSVTVGTDHTRPVGGSWELVHELWIKTELLDDTADAFSLSGLPKINCKANANTFGLTIDRVGGVRLRKVDADFNTLWTKQMKNVSLVRPTEYGVVVQGPRHPSVARGDAASLSNDSFILLENDGTERPLDAVFNVDMNLLCDVSPTGKYEQYSPVLLDD